MRSYVIAFGILLAGCTTGETVTTSQKINGDGVAVCADGLVERATYALPTARVPVTLKMGPKPTAAQTAEATLLSKRISAAQAALKKETDPQKQKEYLDLIKSAEAELKSVRASVSGRGFSVSVGKPIVSADQNSIYTACHRVNGAYDDELLIETDSSGLLKKIEVSSDDRTDDIIRKIADGAVEVAKLFPSQAGLGFRTFDKGGDDDPDVCSKATYEIKLLIDPTNQKSAQDQIDNALLKSMQNSGVLSDKITDAPKCITYTGNSSAGGAAKPPAGTCSDGFCYRRSAPVLMRFEEASTNSSEAFQANIPNNGAIGVVSVDRGAFIKVGATATFENGMLTSISYSRPSEALAVASLPVDVLKSIVSIPTAAFETQSGRLEAEAKVIEAQAALLTAERGLSPSPTAAEIESLKQEIELLKLRNERDALLPPE